MTEARVVLTAEDHASSIIDQVSRRLGIFNKEGIAMGVTFALVNKAVEIVMRGVQMFTDIIKDGIQSSRDLQLNMVYLTNTIDDMDISVDTLKNDLNSLSVTFGIDVNTLATNLRVFTKEGYSTSESLRLLGEAEKFSLATNEDFRSTVEAMNTVMEVFNMDASDSSYILKKLNDIVDETQLSVQNVSDIFGSAAPNIRESGYTLEDMVNILYTLEQAGNRPMKMIRGIVDLLKELEGKKIDILPEDEAPSIEEKYAAIEKTTTNYWDRYSQRIKLAGRETVDYFGSVLDYWADKWLNMYGKKPEATTAPVSTTAQDWMDDYIRKQDSLGLKIADNKKNIDEYTISFANYNQELSRDKGTYYYTIAMHDATLAVQAQEDAIKRLQRVSNTYSLEQFINNLEVMRIQYGAMGSRRGIGRGQQRQIDAIEKENMLLRIKEAEQQIKIGQIQQTGLQTAQDSLDKIRRAHDQVIYQQELVDLSKHIDDVHALWLDMYKTLAQEKAALLNNQNLSVSLTASNIMGPTAPGTNISQLIARGMSRKTFDILGNPFSRMR